MEDSSDFTLIRIEVDHDKKAVKMILPPDLDRLSEHELGKMISEVVRVREEWGARGYHVSYGGSAR